PLEEGVTLEAIAAQTPGFVGADLANLCNEAALFASRRDADKVSARDFQDAIERVIAGTEKKGKVLTPNDRRRVAVHESGHALVGHLTRGADPVQKISIVPRGQSALGYTLQSPEEEQYLKTEEELQGRLRVLLGGRAAEAVVLGNVSTGASDDLEKANQLAKQMIRVFGFGKEELFNLSMVTRNGPGFLGDGPQFEEAPPEFAERLSRAQRQLIADAYQAAVDLINENIEKLEALTDALLEHEKVDASDLKRLWGKRIDAKPSIIPPAPSEDTPGSAEHSSVADTSALAPEEQEHDSSGD
ncbi:MAG: ATP-dependent metallopeptidase FtsH/Yme1/Tma family protein, partial [Polyangiaceae bacterium]|nr:ATP-dependent metallopeptidase FtsH/Yme1/Tma family protein [Polyangiaceae bacterium]